MHIALASAPGSAHVNPGQPGKTNNQDAIVHRTFTRGYDNTQGHVLVLCDGCGSQPYSSTGADLGAHILAEVIANRARDCGPRGFSWEAVTHETLRKIDSIARILASRSPADYASIVVSRFLFTALVCVVDGDDAVIVAFGDGVVVVDSEIIILEPPIPNAPPYLGYRLLDHSDYHATELRQWLSLRVVKNVRISTLDKGILIGTDGLLPLLKEDLHHPALVQPRSLQRWLNVQTTERWTDGACVPGRCPDDVSIAIVRSDEAQTRLVESRREVADLKQRAAWLNERVAELSATLDRHGHKKSELESRAKELEDDADDLRTKASALPELDRAVQTLDSALDDIHERIRSLVDPLPTPIAPLKWRPPWKRP